jgi:hypothetical protein
MFQNGAPEPELVFPQPASIASLFDDRERTGDYNKQRNNLSNSGMLVVVPVLVQRDQAEADSAENEKV